MEPSDDAVKTPTAAPKGAAASRAFARYFEGWELGAITVGLVLAAALVAVPHAAPPSVFPVPLIDVAEAAETRQGFDALADRAEREGLPFETRAVGDAVRKLGVLLSGKPGDLAYAERVLAERVQLALKAKQAEALLRLRAVQARLFVSAVRSQSVSGPVSAELAALGGDFGARAQQNGWVDAAGCVASDDELRTLFSLRWSELTQLQNHPRLKPSLAELRRYYRFLLIHPEQPKSADPPRLVRAQLRLRYAAALGRRDHDYPLALVRGTLLAELAMPEQSSAELSFFLAQPGAGQWVLRARNYLLSVAAERAEEP